MCQKTGCQNMFFEGIVLIGPESIASSEFVSELPTSGTLHSSD